MYYTGGIVNDLSNRYRCVIIINNKGKEYVYKDEEENYISVGVCGRG